MSEDKGRKRPHTILKESNTSTRQARPPKDSLLQADDGTLTIDPVVVVEADDSLQQFPGEVRDQIEEYLKKPDANPKTFVAAMKHFPLRTTAKGEPCVFVEMNTRNILDAATYNCGPALHRGHITVVKPPQGSKFNNGSAAVIHYYGKGGNSDGRNLSSRWSIWTPNGIRADVLVDRMITGPAPAKEEDDDDANKPARKKQLKTIRKKRSVADGDDDDDDTFTLARKKQSKMNKKRQSTRMNTSSSELSSLNEDEEESTIEVERITKSEREGSSLFVSEADEHSYQQDLGSNLPAPHRQSLPAHRGPWGLATSTPVARMPSVLDDTTSITTPSMTAPHGSVPRNTAHIQPTSPNNNQTTISFQRFDGDAHLHKTLTQCDSVEKLFAYAFKAGISGPDLVMLTASVGNFTVDIIRGDHDDFAELLRAIQNEQLKVGEDVAVRVYITSVAY